MAHHRLWAEKSTLLDCGWLVISVLLGALRCRPRAVR